MNMRILNVCILYYWCSRCIDMWRIENVGLLPNLFNSIQHVHFVGLVCVVWGNNTIKQNMRIGINEWNTVWFFGWYLIFRFGPLAACWTRFWRAVWFRMQNDRTSLSTGIYFFFTFLFAFLSMYQESQIKFRKFRSYRVLENPYPFDYFCDVVTFMVNY